MAILSDDDIAPKERKQMGIDEVIFWTFATIVAVPFFGISGLALMDIDSRPTAYLTTGLIGAISGALLGGVLGVVQRSLLPPALRWRQRWIWGTMLGGGIGGSFYWPIGVALYFAGEHQSSVLVGIGPFLGVIVFGMGLGLGQWLCMRPCLPVPWLLLTSCSWTLSTVLTYILNTQVPFAPRSMLEGSVIIGLCLGGIPGLVTGMAIAKFTRPLP